jgi:DNA-binding IclR family transcriptional regulator
MNTVENIARVLRLFTPERSVLSVTEVAQLLGLPKSSTSRLLKAMAESGLLTSADITTGYAVGNLIFETSRRHRVNSTLSLAAD